MFSPESCLVIQLCWWLQFFRCVETFSCNRFNSWYVGLTQPQILPSIAYFDTSANIQELAACTIHLIWWIWHFLNPHQALKHCRTSIDNMYMNSRHVFQTLCRYTSHCILLGWVYPFPDMARIVSSLTEFHCCPIFRSLYQTSYCIHHYILLSAFSNFTPSSSTWNLWPARWGITIHRSITKPTLRDHLQVHWTR
jgi:hypothetical protein